MFWKKLLDQQLVASYDNSSVEKKWINCDNRGWASEPWQHKSKSGWEENSKDIR
jgi:hypothetical protein